MDFFQKVKLKLESTPLIDYSVMLDRLQRFPLTNILKAVDSFPFFLDQITQVNLCSFDTSRDIIGCN